MKYPAYPDGSSQEENIFQAQQGEADSISALVVEYTPLVTLRAKSFLGSGMELEDLLQEGMIGLLAAMRTYRAGQGSSFRTYASHCITNRLLTAVKTYRRNKNRPMNHHISLEEFDEAAGEGTDPQLLFIRQEDQQWMRRQISNLLSEFEREALELYLSGRSYQETATSLGCSTKAVDNALQRVKRKLQTAQE